MPSLERDDIEAGLKKKGFVEADTGRDHRFYKLYVAGKYTGIQTKTSRGTKYKTISTGLVAHMARELKLTSKQFQDLIRCPLSFEGYVELLGQSGERFE